MMIEKRAANVAAIAAGTILGIAAAQMYVLGARGGIGPLKFLKHRKMERHPGNAPQYHPDQLAPLADSPIAGKRLLFLGSSVTKGAASMDVSMADYIRLLDGCEVVKNAVNGTTLADKNRFSYLSRLKEIDTNQRFDAVICQLSTNDARLQIPLGIIGTGKDPNSFDTKTVIGAMEAIIAYIRNVWSCPVIFYTGTKYESDTYQAMVDALLLLQKKWDIGIIDLWNDEEMKVVSQENYALYMNDPVHPTQAGYLLWWVPKFQKYLYKYLSDKTV